jgi:protein ImuB
MRIACLYLPAFRLQVMVRKAPHLAGTVFAVLDEAPGQIARISAASRAARQAGVTLGMTATQARVVCPDLDCVDGNPDDDEQVMRALGEAALALSVTVDITRQGTVFALVPPTRRAATFGERLLGTTSQQGLLGRVGIADDRFTAWAATQMGHTQETPPVRAIKPHGSAAFLAPLELALLPMDADVRRTLRLLGVRTLGDFAALPPPSVGRRWAQKGCELQALARGQDKTPLSPYVPTEPIGEGIELEHEISGLEALSFVLRPLLERVAVRLTGRGRGAQKIQITLAGSSTTQTTVPVAPAQPTASARTLFELARVHLAERTLSHPVLAVQVSVLEEGDVPTEELTLWDTAPASRDSLDVVIARLRAAFGQGAAFGVVLRESHRPEGAFEKAPFGKAGPERPQLPYSGPGVLRLLPSPIAACKPTVDGKTPVRLQGEWWTDAPLHRDYYEVETDDGAHYWLFRDHRDGRLYLHGVFD